jgi:hypothetical protein
MSDRTVWIVVAVALLALYMVTKRKKVLVAGQPGYMAPGASTVYVNGQPVVSGRAASSDAATAVALGVAAAPAAVSLIDALGGLFSSPAVAGDAPVTGSDFSSSWTDDSTDNYNGMDLLGE